MYNIQYLHVVRMGCLTSSQLVTRDMEFTGSGEFRAAWHCFSVVTLLVAHHSLYCFLSDVPWLIPVLLYFQRYYVFSVSRPNSHSFLLISHARVTLCERQESNPLNMDKRKRWALEPSVWSTNTMLRATTNVGKCSDVGGYANHLNIRSL